MESNYYAIIPATVRYDKNLTANAKLLYAEITSLTHKTGYCYATNEYFAELYGVNQNTVREWMSQLEKAGYINREIVYKENTKEVAERRIRIFSLPPLNFQPTPPLNFKGDNNKDMNIKLEEKETYKEKFEEWWSVFPKQRAGSKQKTYLKYKKAIKEEKLTPEFLLEKVKEYANSREVASGYACGGERYFNDCKYNNQYENSDYRIKEESSWHVEGSNW